MTKLKAKWNWWRIVRKAKRWARDEERRVLVERYNKAMTRVTDEDRDYWMKRGVFI